MCGELSPERRNGYCIYIDTFCQGPVTVVSDENGYVVFDSRLQAQREIADHQMTDGVITDADGNRFGPDVE